MQALILVGGYGTRLKPLSDRLPKPLISFCGKPMVEWQIESLVKVGVRRIVLAIGYKEHLMKDFVREMTSKYQIEIFCSVEKEPLNTGGPIKLAENLLSSKEHGDFFVLNSDVIGEFPFLEMLAFHRSHKAMSTILTFEVEDTSRYGVISIDQKTNRVLDFMEKPLFATSKLINAGIYIFSNEVFKTIELRSFSVEKELFPRLCENGQIYSFPLLGFWKDLGIPKDFIEGTRLILDHLSLQGIDRLNDYTLVNNNGPFVGLNLVHKTSKFSNDCTIGPYCVLNENTSVGQGCTIASSILMKNSSIGDNTSIVNSIIPEDESIKPSSLLKDQIVIST